MQHPINCNNFKNHFKMKKFYFKIGKEELTLESTDIKTAYTLAEAWKEHYKWRGRVIFIATQE